MVETTISVSRRPTLYSSHGSIQFSLACFRDTVRLFKTIFNDLISPELINGSEALIEMPFTLHFPVNDPLKRMKSVICV